MVNDDEPRSGRLRRWTTVDLPTGETIKVLTEVRSGYVHIVGIQVPDSGSIDSALLRRIPVGRIVFELQTQQLEATRRVRFAPLSEMAKRRTTPGERDRFYRAVASTYLESAAQSSRPCADIAEGLEISVRTVQGWVSEARRRELLPPGRQGASG